MSNIKGSNSAKQCGRNSAVKIESVKDLKGEPKGDKYHVYYIHRDGTTYRSSDQEFDPKAKHSALETNASLPHINGEQNTHKTGTANNETKNSSIIKTQQIEQCDDDRLILV
jgi:hypothetical protein